MRMDLTVLEPVLNKQISGFLPSPGEGTCEAGRLASVGGCCLCRQPTSLLNTARLDSGLGSVEEINWLFVDCLGT